MNGRGIAVVRGFPIDQVSPEELELVFWAIGLHLGTPVSQSVMGERLGHIRDVTDTDPNARAYRNRNELTPHTDPGDILSFLYIQPARTGGISRFVSSLTIHEEIRHNRPDLFETVSSLSLSPLWRTRAWTVADYASSDSRLQPQKRSGQVSVCPSVHRDGGR
jgi:hypothetical protein